MKWKSLIAAAVAFALLAAAFPRPAGAARYDAFTFKQNGQPRLTQTAYVPMGAIDGYSMFGAGAAEREKKGELTAALDQPQDIFIDARGHIYVADTGNSRVLELGAQGSVIRIVGEGELDEPTGLYVDAAGKLYVADHGAERVFVYGPDGRKQAEIGKPASLLFGKSNAFKPRKITVDLRGNLYVVGEGLVQGLAQLSPDGSFLGYFGANRVGFSLERSLQKLFFTRKQLSQLSQKLPPSPSNVAIGGDGLVFTATVGLEGASIKKLNVAGDNLLHTSSYMSGNIADVTVDRMGNIYAADAVEGFIYVYDKDGSLLFGFGGMDAGYQSLGYFTSPSGIAVSGSGLLYVLDKERGNVQIFKPTPFATLVNKAVSLYLDGKYVDSLEPWREVLRLDSLFDLAHLGLGLAYYKQGRFDEAFDELKFAKNAGEYSNTYWELRREWLMKHASTVMLLLAGIAAAWMILKRLHRRFGFGAPVVNAARRTGRVPLVGQLLHVFRMLRHPIDGFEELTNGKASVLSAFILLVLFAAVRLYEVFQTSFIFSGVDPLRVSIPTELLKLLVPLFAWIVCNYMVSVINDGEGKFRDVLKGSVYALSPYLLFGAPLTVLSKGLTLMESVVYDYGRILIVGWCVVLFILMVKEIHGYEFKETFKNIAITVSGMVIMAVIAFIFFGLSSQVWDFVRSIAEEVKYRG
ncbi:YIP1 family protein [Paenibacillus sp. GCM10023250]|uniref:YIP1 family protein n=1 Tax=Paenibacillus sp. GCM10023250 TaxID=3252648 RepID=UPI003622A743